MYDPTIGRWWSTDPEEKQRPEWAPYNSMRNNPIKNIDPDGRLDGDHLEVTKNEDKTYTVTGGVANSDRNIYVVDKKGVRTGEVLGKMLTEYSFHDNDGNAVKGAAIDPGDRSGIKFMNDELIIPKVLLFNYISNAKGNQLYDFKTRGINKRGSLTQSQYVYRGMPFEGVKHFGDQDAGITTFASARDFGNVGAGYIAGVNGLGWNTARLGFDGLETWQTKDWWSVEGQPSQRAERIGHNIGIKVFKPEQIKELINQSRRPLWYGPKQ